MEKNKQIKIEIPTKVPKLQ